MLVDFATEDSRLLRACRSAGLAPVCHRVLAAATVAVGGADQFLDALARRHGLVEPELHALFGASLLACVAATIFYEARSGASGSVLVPPQVRRRLKRGIFLLMYGLALTRKLADVGLAVWQGGTVASAGALAVSESPEFAIYLAYAVLAIFSMAPLIRLVDRSKAVDGAVVGDL
jgi:hypothetical protein